MCGPAEQAVAKLLTTSIYYTITSVLALAVESYSTSITPNYYLTALLPYFTCESTGYDETKNCKRFLAEIQQTHLLKLSFAFSEMIGLLPLVLFLVNTNFKLYAKKMKQAYLKLRNCSVF